MKTRYKTRSHISDKKIRQIIKCFCMDFAATNTSQLIYIFRLTINKYYDRFRKIILFSNLSINDKEEGEFELDESYFGAKRIKGKRGRGAAGKTPVFGLLKRAGNVEVVNNCSKDELMPIIEGKILEGSTIP